MGDLILLSERVHDRSRPTDGATAFFFELGCPLSYLAAERVERLLGEIDWVPVLGLAETASSEPDIRRTAAQRMALAEEEAKRMRLPLLAPEQVAEDATPADNRKLSRAAMFAADCGDGARFALAAARLVFCGGFELDDPEVISEAAAAAGISEAGALAAADDERHDQSLDTTARGLTNRGVLTIPAIRVGTRWFQGLDAVGGAATYAAVRRSFGTPLRPAS